jgi:hypothetical protein
MHCKKFITILLTLLMTLVCLAGPKQKDALSHVKFGKWRIVSLVPTGLRSMRVGVEMEAKNDTTAFMLQDVKMDFFRKGKPFVEGVCEEIVVPKGTSTVRLSGDFELADEVSLWSAVTSLKNADPSEFTVNVDLNVISSKGRKIAWSQNDISVGSLAGKKSDKKTDRKTDGEEVSMADTPASTTAKPAGKPASQNADQPKQTTKKKRPWWQFWKK